MAKTIQFSDLNALAKIIFIIEGIAVLGGLVTLILIIVSITK